MTPQSNFMIVAPIAAGQADALRALLATMNRQPGNADPENMIVPFHRLESAGYAVTVIKNAWWRVFVPEQRPIPHNRWLVAFPRERP